MSSALAHERAHDDPLPALGKLYPVKIALEGRRCSRRTTGISGAGTHQGPSLPGDELGSGADQNPASQCPDANHGLWSACAYGGGQSTGSRRGPQGHGRLTPLPTRKNRSHHAPSTTHTRVRRRTYVRILELSSQLIQEDAGARPHPLL